MNKVMMQFFIVAVLSAQLIASELTRTELSFERDENGNINPKVYIPIYYGANNQFYSGIGYTAFNTQSVEELANFTDSKIADVSDVQTLELNYISYISKYEGFDISIGVGSLFSQIKNNEFGYINDSGNYISLDNATKLDIQRHGILLQLEIPISTFLSTRLSTNVAPFSTISVDQETLIKPLISEVGMSQSSTTQELSYAVKFEAQTSFKGWIDFGLVAYYDYQPLKYDIAEVSDNGSSYVFETVTKDTLETTMGVTGKIVINVDVMGGLKPSFGYGIEKFERTSKNDDIKNTYDRTIMTLGLEKRF